jgi:homoserine O-acetyltransferase
VRPGTSSPDEFPELSVSDQAGALASLLAALGIQRARAVIGFSLGGMVALAFGALYPDRAAAVASVFGPASMGRSARRRMGMVGQLLSADPEYGRVGEGTRRALSRARLAALRDLYPRDYLLARFPDLFAAERALHAEADSFSESFDARCYLTLVRCMASGDLTESLGRYGPKVMLLACSSDELATPSSMRDTYHALTAAGGRTRYVEIQSEAGHRACYLEPEKIAPALGEVFS